VLSYRKFLDRASGQYAQPVAHARQRLLELELGSAGPEISDEDIPF